MGGSGIVRCRLISSITPPATDVKGGAAAWLPLASEAGGVTQIYASAKNKAICTCIRLQILPLPRPFFGDV